MSEIIRNQNNDENYDNNVRPLSLDDFNGQSETLKNLSVYIRGAVRRDESMDHILFYGPPGLGKTTLSRIIAGELGVGFKSISAPAISKPADLVSLLISLDEKDVLFIDEIHRLPLVVEELLYGAMEDNLISVIVSGDNGAPEPIEIPINSFTLVAATTRKGALSQPLSDRFGIQFRMDYYSAEDLQRIVQRAASILDISLDEESIFEVSKRSRGTPRIALRIMRRLRDFIEDEGVDFVVNHDFTSNVLDNLGINKDGLDEMDQKYLDALTSKFRGGPVGIDTLCAAISESRDTVESVIEPYLLRGGYILRTPKGRKLNVETPEDEQLKLI